MKQYIPLLLTLVLVCSCAKPDEYVVEIPEPLEEIQSPNSAKKQSGSLWSNSNSSMFSDHKAKNVGDLVTVTISEKSSASKQASTSSDRTSDITAGIPNFFGLENNDYVTDTGIDLSNLISANFANTFEGAGKTVRSGDLTASLSTQVIGVYPNGNFKIRGGKEVMVNNEIQIIYLTGIVRPVDITAMNTIDSNKVLNARISYTGKGAVADKQKPGWLMRTVDNVWPF